MSDATRLLFLWTPIAHIPALYYIFYCLLNVFVNDIFQERLIKAISLVLADRVYIALGPRKSIWLGIKLCSYISWTSDLGRYILVLPWRSSCQPDLLVIVSWSIRILCLDLDGIIQICFHIDIILSLKKKNNVVRFWPADSGFLFYNCFFALFLRLCCTLNPIVCLYIWQSLSYKLCWGLAAVVFSLKKEVQIMTCWWGGTNYPQEVDG